VSPLCTARRLGATALAACALPLVLVAFLTPLLIPGSALAQGERALPIVFEVIVVHGSTREGVIEESCAAIHSRLKMMRFRSLRMVQQQVFSISLGHPVGMQLPTGKQLRLMPIAVLSGRLHLQFEVPGVVNTRLALENGRPVILGGARHQDGQLIIEVTPRFTADAGPHPTPRGPDLERINGVRPAPR